MALRAGRDVFTSLQSGFVKNKSTTAVQQEQEAWSSSYHILLAVRNVTFPKGLLSTKPDKQVIRSSVTLPCLGKGKDSSSPAILLQ